MNSVEIVGYIKRNIDDRFREIQIPLPGFNEFEKNSANIIARYWQNESKLFTSLPINTRIIARAHIDNHPDYGTILILEMIEKVTK